MGKIISNLFLITAVCFITLTTSIAAYKIAQDAAPVSALNSDISPSVEELKNSTDNLIGDDIFPGFPTAVVTPAGGTIPQGSTNLCLITIAGKKYNFNNLRRTHSGGDVFVCNTDMTGTYQRQHGTNYSRIAGYLYIPGSNNSSSSSNNNIPGKVFTFDELALHNKPADCYIAYNQHVYDVSAHPQWSSCIHNGIRGGQDITSRFPHSTSYLSILPLLGSLQNGAVTTGSQSIDDDDESEEDTEDHEIEYEGIDD